MGIDERDRSGRQVAQEACHEGIVDVVHSIGKSARNSRDENNERVVAEVALERAHWPFGFASRELCDGLADALPMQRRDQAVERTGHEHCAIAAADQSAWIFFEEDLPVRRTRLLAFLRRNDKDQFVSAASK